MTRQDLWSAIMGSDGEQISLAEEVGRSSFDDQLEINLRTGGYRMLHHLEDKYVGNTEEGDFRRLYRFAAEHFVHPEDREAYRAMLDPDTLALRLEQAPVPGILRGDFRMKSTDGQWIYTRQVLISGPELGFPAEIVQCYIYDTTRQRRRVAGEKPQPQYAVRREEITGLLHGVDYFREVQSRMEDMAEGWCLVYLEIEHHKLFTEWYGLDSGQYLLTQVAEVLQRAATADGGVPGYLGEEDFCLTMPYEPERIRALYDEIKTMIVSEASVEGFQPIFGIAPIDGSCRDIREYFNKAALTAEEARNDMHTRIRTFDSKLHRKNTEEYQLLYAFQHAIERGEITFWLQPQCRLPDHKIVGAESLARWTRPDGTMISPAVFVPLLEKYGLVTELDTFIWESVCQWIRSWIDRGMQPVPVSVNVSRIDVFSMDVPAYFDALIRKYQLSHTHLKVEITESAYAGDPVRIGDTVNRLRQLGFLVLMDDFGSGYSSLNMLSNVDVDVIKLDARFLQLEGEERNKGISILESVVNMTRNLATPIIVEGVETREQVEFLTNLGCSYMQGFYFFKPVPVENLESYLADGSHIDTHGIIFKANQQIRVREFLDEHIFSDAMLNNLLGPVAFYSWHGESVDIIRYNQQFYELVGIEASAFGERQNGIERFLHPDDRKELFGMLARAEAHPVNGASGVIRCFRPNGVLVWLSLHVYFLDEEPQGKRYYISARDVSEQQFISSDLPGGYFRCLPSEQDFAFLFISENFQEMTGYSESEIRALFDNKLVNMVHPADVTQLKRDSHTVSQGAMDRYHPYRISRKGGGYVYVAEQSHLTDRYGTLCWQCVVVDVTDVMNIRNQMRILSGYLTDTILFLRRERKDLQYEVAVHGLGDLLGMSVGELSDSLNNGEFCRYIRGYQEGIPHSEYTQRFVESILGVQRTLTVCLPDREPIALVVRADRVTDVKSAIEYIVILHQEERTESLRLPEKTDRP